MDLYDRIAKLPRYIRDNREGLFGVGLSRTQKVQRSFWNGLKFGGAFIPTSVGMIAFQAARSEKGGFIPAVIGQTLALGPGILLGGAASAAVALIPGIGPLLAPWIGEAITTGLELRLGNEIARGVRVFTDMNKNIRHLEMGGSYQDSELAQRQRFIALQDMSAAMIPSRRYLGQEALLMHR